MIRQAIDIDGWHCDFWIAEDRYDHDAVIRQLFRMDAPQPIIAKVHGKMLEGRLDEGFTYSTPRLRQSLVVIGKASSGAEFLSSFCHELRHLTDDIATADGRALDSESVAYMTGDIALRLAGQVCRFTCDHCRR